jgi:hypothetical protein
MTDEQLNARFNKVDDRLAGLDERLTGIDERFEILENKLLEAMRDMQTELLRGMAAYSGSITLRVRKIEADQSNLDAALSGRVDILEKRLGEIEQRLGRV